MDIEPPPYAQAVTDRQWAEMIVRAYWRRYAAQALRESDLETLARVHNGGPAGAHKRATVKYWERVRNALEASR